MAKVGDLISARTKKGKNPSKMMALAGQSSSGERSSFAGIFSVGELNDSEKALLQEILEKYSTEPSADHLQKDLTSLISITSEIKAINNQAILLHGERIKRVQTLLKQYQEGAFSAWLISSYGNRQTPYNFLQYFEFYQTVSKTLQPKVEEMPKQAIYSLASREGSFEQKETIVKQFAGQTKKELLEIIRETFPLSLEDKRKKDPVDKTIQILKGLSSDLERESISVSQLQKKEIHSLLRSLKSSVEKRVILP